MKKPVISPVIKFQERPYSRFLYQEVKRPNRTKYKVKFDEVSLLLVQNKVVGSLSPIDQQLLVDSIGVHSPDIGVNDDNVLASTVNSRRLQEPSDIRRELENSAKTIKFAKDSLKKTMEKNDVDPKVE